MYVLHVCTVQCIKNKTGLSDASLLNSNYLQNLYSYLQFIVIEFHV